MKKEESSPTKAEADDATPMRNDGMSSFRGGLHTPGPAHAEFRDRNAAKAAYEAAIEESPGDSYSMHHLGLLHEEAFRDFATAREWFRKAVAVNRANFAAWSSLGLSLMGSDPNESLQCFDEALSINNRYCRAHKNRGILLFRESFKLLRPPKKHTAKGHNDNDQPDDEDATSEQPSAGDMRAQADAWVAEAVSSLDRALDVDPANASVMVALGEVHETALHDLFKAERYYQASLRADAANPSGFYHLSTLYEKGKKDFVQARKFMESALMIDKYETSALSKYAKQIEMYFPSELALAHFVNTFLCEISSKGEKEGRWRSKLKKFCTRHQLNRKLTCEELHHSVGVVPFVDSPSASFSSSSSSFDDAAAAEKTTHECPRQHMLARIFHKPRVFSPRCTWACEECKRSILGSDLTMKGVLFCATCKYLVCSDCSKRARIAHHIPEPPVFIGKGAFGEVMKEFSGEHRTYCAVKRIRGSQSANDQAMRKMVEREVQMMLHFKEHPNIVRLYACVPHATTGDLEMWMELMKESVGDRVQRAGAMRELDARRVIGDALRGLCALHAFQPRPVIHRDIKPGNLLIAQDGQTVKLSDFGLSKLGTLDGTVQQSEIKGTPQFLAPECFHGRKPLWTVKADVWAIACTWISIVTGNPSPYGAPHMNCLEHMYFFFSEKVRGPDIPPCLSKRAQAVLAKCLEVDHAKRPTAHDLLRDEYFALSQEKLHALLEQEGDGMEGEDTFVERTRRISNATAAAAASRQLQDADDDGFPTPTSGDCFLTQWSNSDGSPTAGTAGREALLEPQAHQPATASTNDTDMPRAAEDAIATPASHGSLTPLVSGSGGPMPKQEEYLTHAKMQPPPPSPPTVLESLLCAGAVVAIIAIALVRL